MARHGGKRSFQHIRGRFLGGSRQVRGSTWSISASRAVTTERPSGERWMVWQRPRLAAEAPEVSTLAACPARPGDSGTSAMDGPLPPPSASFMRCMLLIISLRVLQQMAHGSGTSHEIVQNSMEHDAATEASLLQPTTPRSQQISTSALQKQNEIHLSGLDILYHVDVSK